MSTYGYGAKVNLVELPQVVGVWEEKTEAWGHLEVISGKVD